MLIPPHEENCPPFNNLAWVGGKLLLNPFNAPRPLTDCKVNNACGQKGDKLAAGGSFAMCCKSFSHRDCVLFQVAVKFSYFNHAWKNNYMRLHHIITYKKIKCILLLHPLFYIYTFTEVCVCSYLRFSHLKVFSELNFWCEFKVH